MPGFFVTRPRLSIIHVPHELSEMIIRHLKTDFKSLISAALVCKSWASASRSDLFHDLTLKSDAAEWFAEALSSFIPQPNPKIPTNAVIYCRTLHIHDLIITTSTCACVDGDAPMLKQHPLQSFYSTLTSLSVSHSAVPRIESFMVYISMFSSLQSIALNDVSFNEQPSTEAVKQLFSDISSVKAISIRNMNIKPFFAYINRINVLPNVTHMTVDQVDQWNLSDAGMFIHRISNSLEFLSVKFRGPKGQRNYICGSVPIVVPPSHMRSRQQPPTDSNPVRDEYLRIWGLETSIYTCPNLKTLRFEDFLNIHNGEIQVVGQFWAPRVIASTVALKIERLEFGLRIDFVTQIDKYDINWQFLEYTLASDDWKSLKHVTFRVNGSVDLENLANLISMRMPLVSERGILGFCRTDKEGR